jgi:hypothetical protein
LAFALKNYGEKIQGVLDTIQDTIGRGEYRENLRELAQQAHRIEGEYSRR